MTKNPNFQARLKELRHERGITQKALAQEAGISLSSVINYENGQRFPVSGVLVLLQRYFNVSREYLLGESDVRVPAPAWDDSEATEALNDNLSALLSTLEQAIRACPDQEQKLTFDILVELRHVLGLEDHQGRAAAISLLQSVFSASTRYVDVCLNATQDVDPALRIEKAKQVAHTQYDQALEEAHIFLSD